MNTVVLSYKYFTKLGVNIVAKIIYGAIIRASLSRIILHVVLSMICIASLLTARSVDQHNRLELQ